MPILFGGFLQATVSFTEANDGSLLSSLQLVNFIVLGAVTAGLDPPLAAYLIVK